MIICLCVCVLSTRNQMTIKEAYESAATEKLAGVKEYTTDITHQLASQFHVTEASYSSARLVQTSNGATLTVAYSTVR